jgi:hypothetical protein
MDPAKSVDSQMPSNVSTIDGLKLAYGYYSFCT